MINIKQRSLNQVTKGIQLHTKSINKLLNQEHPLEAVSVQLISSILEDAFGYAKDCIYPQENINNKHVDLAIHYDKQTFLCECKRFHKKSHLDKDGTHNQLKSYCEAKQSEWGILTDGIRWELYCYDLKTKALEVIAKVDFLDLPKRITKQYCEKFYIFHSKVSSKDRKLFRARKEALSQLSIYRIIHSIPCVNLIKKIIKQQTGYKVSNEQLEKVLGRYFPLPTGIRRVYQCTKRSSSRSKETLIKNETQGEIK